MAISFTLSKTLPLLSILLPLLLCFTSTEATYLQAATVPTSACSNVIPNLAAGGPIWSPYHAINPYYAAIWSSPNILANVAAISPYAAYDVPAFASLYGAYNIPAFASPYGAQLLNQVQTNQALSQLQANQLINQQQANQLFNQQQANQLFHQQQASQILSQQQANQLFNQQYYNAVQANQLVNAAACAYPSTRAVIV